MVEFRLPIGMREGVAKVAPSNFGVFLWETSGLQKHLTT